MVRDRNKQAEPARDASAQTTERTGAAWTDRPAKTDGLTNAEKFTNERVEKR